MELKMKKIIGANLSGILLLISMGLLAIFHIFILLKVIPSDIVWGGQIDLLAINLFTLEITALLVTLVFTVIVAAKMDYIKANKFKKAINIDVWFIFGYLILNTLGNLLSGISFENLIFAPISMVLAICALRLAVEK
jgi:hypothetical protein